MKYFIWQLKVADEKYFASTGGISNHYIVPYLSGISPRHFIGAFIFFLVNGSRGNVLFKVINVLNVEEFNDDNASAPRGFLLTVNILKSFRVVQSYKDGLPDYFVSLTINRQSQIYEITFEEANKFIEIIKKNIPIMLKAPNVVYPISLARINVSASPKIVSSFILSELARSFSLDVLSGSQKYKNPFLNIAANFANTLNTDNRSEIIKELECISSHFFDITAVKREILPKFDVELVPIDISHIYSRKFHSIKENTDYDDIFVKTENAEKRHQEILRDICKYMIGRGHIPLRSNSIDLALKIDNKFAIYEIKTTTSENVIHQCAKGVFQLALYSQAMLKVGYTNINKIIILEDFDNIELKTTIINATVSLNMKVSFYDQSKHWPDRVRPEIDITG
jgi:hypothetical protein